MADLDPQLFGDGPARDSRFTVVDYWQECENLPDDHPMKEVEFLHRQMNEEINGMENAANSVADFPDAEWDLRMCLARQCYDEARHVLMFRKLFEERGVHVGQFPVLNFQYRIISKINTLIGRLAVQNRSFEADGIDAIGFGVQEAGTKGDLPMRELLEAQLADEITHVRFANEYIRSSVFKNPRSAIWMGVALDNASKAFRKIMGEEGTDVTKYGIDSEARLEAGFQASEVRTVAEQSSLRSAKRTT